MVQPRLIFIKYPFFLKNKKIHSFWYFSFWNVAIDANSFMCFWVAAGKPRAVRGQLPQVLYLLDCKYIDSIFKHKDTYAIIIIFSFVVMIWPSKNLCWNLCHHACMQSDAYQATGCYNLLCSGFVQTNNKIAIGAAISPTSAFNGGQFDISLLIWKV